MARADAVEAHVARADELACRGAGPVKARDGARARQADAAATRAALREAGSDLSCVRGEALTDAVATGALAIIVGNALNVVPANARAAVPHAPRTQPLTLPRGKRPPLQS